MKDVKTTKNICYFNGRSDSINYHVHKNIIKIPEGVKVYDHKIIKNRKEEVLQYYEGMELICRKHLIINNEDKSVKKVKKSKNAKITDGNLIETDENGYKLYNRVRLFVNYTYNIISIHDDHMILGEPVDKIKFKIYFKDINKFKLPYSGTAHSYQGLSIKEAITIFDTNICYTNRNWIWTSITRARDLSKVNIFVHSESSKINLVESKIKQYFKFKIDSYIQQDKKTNRYNPNNYIDVEWFINRLDMNFKDCPTFNSYCPDCNMAFELNFNENNDILSNISADRKDNSLGHNKSNIRLCCVKCNVKKGNR